MFEFLFFVLFIGILFFTGLSIMTILAAVGVSIIVMLVLGMIGAAIELVPWLIAIVIGVWFYKNYIKTAG